MTTNDIKKIEQLPQTFLPFPLPQFYIADHRLTFEPLPLCAPWDKQEKGKADSVKQSKKKKKALYVEIIQGVFPQFCSSMRGNCSPCI